MKFECGTRYENVEKRDSTEKTVGREVEPGWACTSAQHMPDKRPASQTGKRVLAIYRKTHENLVKRLRVTLPLK